MITFESSRPDQLPLKEVRFRSEASEYLFRAVLEGFVCFSPLVGIAVAEGRPSLSPDIVALRTFSNARRKNSGLVCSIMRIPT